MKWFRHKLHKNWIFILTLLSVNVFYMVDGAQFVYAHQLHEKKEDRLKEISELLDLPVEKLRPDHETLLESMQKVFGFEPEDPVKAAGLKRLQEALRTHEEQLAANPYLPRIEQVKNERQIHYIEGVIQDLMQLTDPTKSLLEGSQKAIFRNLHHSLEERVELPPLAAGLPAKARARHAEMQAKLDRFFDSVRPIVAATQDTENMQGTMAQKAQQLRLFQGAETRRAKPEARFVDRPLPLRRVERKARTLEVSALESQQAPEPVPGAAPPAAKILKDAVAPELVELAESLGNSPAKIFRHVHDRIGLDPKWGAFKGPLGTLWEQSGTSWEQAWLLQQLLQAAGVDARFEWGEIEISTELLTHVAGLDDPWRAGDLLTTAGLPIVLLVQGSQVIGARMSHVWVKAFVDYTPNRGATPGVGDTWVLMDPALKRFDYAPGIQIHDDVPFSLGDYLSSGTELSPRRAFEESLWGYIRANDISCTTLEQLKPSGRIVAEEFPFLPGTLRGKILRLDGEASEVPAEFQERLRVEVRSAAGNSLVAWDLRVPEAWNQRLELAWQGATPEDQVTLDSHGGVFQTPPYLVDLRPVVKLGGLELVSGAAIGSAEEIEIFVTLTSVAGVDDVFVHDGLAGEPGVLLTSFSQPSQQLLSQFQEQQLSASASGDEAALEAATLQLLGATYFHNLGRDVADLTGWSWHRLIRLVSEGLIVQAGNVTTTLDGTPLSFTKAERFVDFPGFVVGLFHTQGQTEFIKPTLELAGAQGSFLEGEVFDQVVEREGIAAVSALTRARREGQAITRVDGANVDTVLAAVELGQDVEDQVRAAVGNGQIAWVPESLIDVNDWRGAGYILENPVNGAAAYMISGGLAGGIDTGGLESVLEWLGNEAWISEGQQALLAIVLAILRAGSPDSDGPGSNQSDPVNMATGNQWQMYTDLTVQARAMPIGWSRTYNSRSDHVGPLGYGWTFEYGVHLEERSDGAVILREGDGTEHLFTPDPGGGFQSPAGKHLTLTENASGFEMRDKEGTLSRFDPSGRLLSITDSNSNAVTLTYDGSGNLASIVDAGGRTAMTVTTVGGRITEIVDLTGRSVKYQYTGDDLTAVTDAAGKIWTFSYDGAHNLIARTDPLGFTENFAYDALDRCIRHTDALGESEHFLYSSRGRSAVLTDKRGFSKFFEFDDRGRVTLETGPLGNAERVTWDDDNNRTSLTDARGGLTVWTYDDRGNLLSETDPANQTRTYTYEPVFNQLLTLTEPDQSVVTFTYSATGNLEETRQMVDGEAITDTYDYDAFGQLIESRDPLGQPTRLAWDSMTGHVLSFSDALDNTTTLTTDPRGQVTRIENALQDETLIEYDALDRATSITEPHGTTLTLTYDDAGRLTERTSPQGTDVLGYDALGRLTSVTDSLGQTRFTEYDAIGHVTAQVDALGNRTSFFYDALGRPTSVVDPMGHVWTYGYCAELDAVAPGGDSSPGSSDNFCELTDPLGNTIRQEVDALGRVNKKINALGHATDLEWDSQDRLVGVTDALNRTTRFEHDGLGRLAAVVEPTTARTEYTYNGAGKLANVKDAENRNWVRTFDELNRLKTEVNPLNQTTRYFYDVLGNLARKINADSQEITIDYDGDRVTAIHLPDGSVESFGYDAIGRRNSMANGEVSLSHEHDALDRLIRTVNHTLGQTLDYEYDAAGNLIRMAGPRGDVTYFYDRANRLVEQHDPVTGIYRYEYDPLGRRQALHYPNGISTEYHYDSASQMTNLVTRDAGGEVIDGYSYEYDVVGNRVSMTSLRDGEVDSYEYDDADRLERWQRGDDRFEEYTYDLVGNRRTLSDQGGATTYSHDLANRLLSEIRDLTGGGSLTTEYTWNATGNLVSEVSGSGTTTYEWDALNRLVQLDGPSGLHTYGYDPKGVRVRESRGGDTRRFLHAREDVVSVFDDSNSLVNYFTHGLGFDEALAQADSARTSYLHMDGLGSVTALSTPDGAVSGTTSYAPFGGVESHTGDSSRYGFTGRELDPTGQMYHRARYYRPETGTFTSKDPFGGTLDWPASQHDYAYAHNNPLRYTDPTGLSVEEAKGMLRYLKRFFTLVLGKPPGRWLAPHKVTQTGFVIAIILGAFICYFSEDPLGNSLFMAGLAFMIWGLVLLALIGIMLGRVRASPKSLLRLVVFGTWVFGFAFGCYLVHFGRTHSIPLWNLVYGIFVPNN